MIKITAQKKQKWVFALIIIFVFLLFSIALKNDFVYWDDPRYVFENDLIRKPSFKNLIKIFQSVVLLNYHPVTMLSFWVNSSLFGMDPFSFILTNILLHLINVFLIYRFLIKLNFELKIAILVSFFWAIHPMHVESIVWVSSRKDLLSTLFILMGLIQYIDYKYFKLNKIILVYTFFCLACLSKMNAICFPIILLIIDYWFGIQIDFKNIKSKIFFLSISMIFFILSYNLLGKGDAFGLLEIQGASQDVLKSKNSFIENLSFASMGLGIYFLKLIMPYQLHHWYVYPEFQKHFFLFLIIPILIFVFFFKSKNKLIKFGLLFFLITIILVLQIVQNSKSMLAERYTYLPYLGLMLPLITIFENNQTIKCKNLIYLIFGCYFSFMTFNYIKTWSNTISIWENTFKFHPNNKEVAISLINLQNNKGSEKAYSTCKKAIAAGLKEPQVFLTMAQIELKAQDYQDALSHLSMAEFYNFNSDSALTQSINLNKSAVFGWLGNADSSTYYMNRFQENIKK